MSLKDIDHELSPYKSHFIKNGAMVLKELKEDMGKKCGGKSLSFLRGFHVACNKCMHVIVGKHIAAPLSSILHSVACLSVSLVSVVSQSFVQCSHFSQCSRS